MQRRGVVAASTDDPDADAKCIGAVCLADAARRHARREHVTCSGADSPVFLNTYVRPLPNQCKKDLSRMLTQRPAE